ncbi:hypothetical protein [Streptomyces sp. SID13031]|uniref:hypothetical protein n=1 Tax=Streptomyces sp. SID13031 TaxID=2706046 RepID=UPI0019426AFB|nr:hypothetical protein [Streptomyces sp. SID13031]
MIFTRRFGALAARPQFPDAPELQQELAVDVELQQHHDDEQTESGDRPERVTTAA